MQKVNLNEKFSRFHEHWRPKVIAEINGQEVKLVKFKGPFVWHHHDDADEMFLTWRGSFRVEFRDHTVDLFDLHRRCFFPSPEEPFDLNNRSAL